MNLAVAANDDRAIEVLAAGLPLFFGAQLAVDITVRCALAADGTPGSTEPCAPELGRTRNGRTQNSSVATGVVWSLSLSKRERKLSVESLAAVRARDAPPALFHSAALAWRRRWSRMVAVSVARSFSSSLVALPAALHGVDGTAPDLVDLLE